MPRTHTLNLGQLDIVVDPGRIDNTTREIYHCREGFSEAGMTVPAMGETSGVGRIRT